MNTREAHSDSQTVCVQVYPHSASIYECIDLKFGFVLDELEDLFLHAGREGACT
jgi:hypothetical protein